MSCTICDCSELLSEDNLVLLTILPALWPEMRGSVMGLEVPSLEGMSYTHRLITALFYEVQCVRQDKGQSGSCL